METQSQTLLEKLLSASDILHSERGRLQSFARALTPGEIKRFETLNNAIPHLDNAVNLLKEIETEVEPLISVNLKEGMYIADDQYLSAELRIDIRGTNVISMDIFKKNENDKLIMLSLRTNPGNLINERQKEFSVICEDKTQKTVAGTLSLAPSNDSNALVSLVLADSLEGLAANTLVLFEAKWESSWLRRIGLETEIELGLDDVGSYEFNSKLITVRTCFEDAGIKLVTAGEADKIPTSSGRWDDSQLHGLMSQFAEASLNKPDWILHMLLLSKAKTEGLLGIMFDTGKSDINGLPRQGAAIFLKEIEKYYNANLTRKKIQTEVHELGHALNLAHRFEREVGRAESTSFMNYDWRYLGGNNSDKFWQDFKFSFDMDELRFIRHAPWWKLIPGGAEFHSVKYWNEGTGGYSPYLPELNMKELKMELALPPTGSLFDFAVPVFLTFKLTNVSNKNIFFPAIYLDTKAGFMEILIKKIGASSSVINSLSFKPILSRCFNIQKDVQEFIKPGETKTNNINLTFGCSGFSFVEPGNYEITAVLSLWDDNYNYVVKSDPLQIRIAFPKDKGEESDALKIFTKDVGYYFALGGSDVLPHAEQKLESVKVRRMKAENIISDPLVAYITRCQAINQSREFVIYRDRKYSTRKANSERAIELFNQLKRNEDIIFDEHTLNGMKTLLKTLEENKSGRPV